MARKSKRQVEAEDRACQSGLELGKIAVDVMVEGYLGLRRAGPVFLAEARGKPIAKLVDEVQTGTEAYFEGWSPAQLAFDEIDEAPDSVAAGRRYNQCFRKAAEHRLRERGFVRK